MAVVSNCREQLTVALVHFNTPEATARCVDSLLPVLRGGAAGEAFRIVVVDNRSEAAHFELLQASLAKLAAPEIILVRNCINAGFGLGCMMALNHSAGRFIAFVNSDTLFDEDCFSPLMAHLDGHDDIGAIGPQHRCKQGKPQRSYGFNESLVTRITGRRKAAPPAGPIEVDYIFGAFMMFRREALADCGGFDPTIFLFYEEMDICQRLRACGYKTAFFPGVGFRHIGQASFKSGDDIKTESDLSLLYVMRKNRGYWAWRALRLSKLLSYALRAIARPRHRVLLRRLMTMGPPQALSWRVRQKCNFDYINR